VTFKDLQRAIQSQSQTNLEHSQQQLQQQQLNRLRGKPFWYWDQNLHKHKDRIYKGDICFNHIIGLPRKDGIEKPIFNYEREIYHGLVKPSNFNIYPHSLEELGLPRIGRIARSDGYTVTNVFHPFKEKHLWIKKATGLGVTEFMLRFMASAFAMMIIGIVRCLL
jgi:hypothetical protein